MGNSGAKPLTDFCSRLLKEKVEATDVQFWRLFFDNPVQTADLREQLTPDLVREIRDQQRENVAAFLELMIREIHDITQDAFVLPISQQSVNTLLSCVRMITHLMPFLLEDRESEVANFIFWTKREPVAAAKEGETTAEESPVASQVLLGVELLEALHRLFFLPGFTIHRSCTSAFKIGESPPIRSVEKDLVWKGGVFVEQNSGMTVPAGLTSNRIDVLTCFLMTLAEPLYMSVRTYQSTVPRFQEVIGRGQMSFTATFFASILNVALTGQSKGLGLPYGHAFSSKLETELSKIAVRVLCSLLDFNPNIWNEQTSSNAESKQDPAVSKQDPDKSYRNVFREIFKEINEPDGVQFMLEGFHSHFETLLSSSRTYLPGSRSRIEFHEELLVLFWQGISLNPAFFQRFLSTDSDQGFYNTLTAVLFSLLEASNARRTPESPSPKEGLVHLCCFVLLLLSADREFCVRLNAPFDQKFPLSIPSFQGTYADLMVLVLHRVIVETVPCQGWESQIDMLLTAICNISPYVKSFCLETSVKLVALLERFSKPSWIFRGMYRFQNLYFLLDTLSNIIQYQYEGNTRLVYTLLRQKHVITDLQNLDLQTYLRNRAAKKTDQENQTQKETEEWEPTESWFQDRKAKLPIATVLRLVTNLLPIVEKECQAREVIDQQEVLVFLKKITMVGILPVPHAIIIRNYQPSHVTDIWFSSYLWGLILSKYQDVPMFDWRKVKLIAVEGS